MSVGAGRKLDHLWRLKVGQLKRRPVVCGAWVRVRRASLGGPKWSGWTVGGDPKAALCAPAVDPFGRRDGKPWTLTDWQNWRRRIYTPASRGAGVTNPRPYDLRHSFVSLLIHEGRSVVEVARQAGHAPTMTLTTYAHVFDEFTLGERLPLRGADPPGTSQARTRFVPHATPRQDGNWKTPHTEHGRSRTRTGDFLLVRQAL